MRIYLTEKIDVGWSSFFYGEGEVRADFVVELKVASGYVKIKGTYFFSEVAREGAKQIEKKI